MPFPTVSIDVSGGNEVTGLAVKFDGAYGSDSNILLPTVNAGLHVFNVSIEAAPVSSDYSVASLTLTGPDGDKFALTNGGVLPCEFRVGATNLASGRYAVSCQLNITLEVGPPPVISISSDQVSKVEGNSGVTTFTFLVTRGGDLSGASSVSYAVSGAADADDFGGVLPSGTVSFAEGEITQTISIDVSGDTTVESDELFTVTLSSPVGATLDVAAASATILNDDTPPPVLSIAADQVDKSEGDAGSTAFTFTVTRTGDLSGSSSASWAVSGAAVDAADFGGSLPSGTVNFAALDATQTITVNVAGDVTVESDEAFTVTLSAPSGATLGTATASSTILNDDSLALPVLSIAADQASKAEGNAGTTAFGFTVTRTGDTSGTSSASYAVTGAANAADFGGSLPSGTVSFAIGETSKPVTINVSGDNTFEPDESFTVTLSAPVGATIAPSGESASATITNDDALPVLSITANQVSKAEGNSGTTPFTFTVARTGADLSVTSTVNWAVIAGGATASDFSGGVLPSGSLTFVSSDTSKTITVNVTGDTTFESDEAFSVQLSSPSNATLGTSSASSTILNDDAAPPAPAPASAVITMGGSAYTFTATGGTELDPWVDPLGQFTQRCIKCTSAGLPGFRAYYRPDVTGGREEWVFELSDLWIVPKSVASVTAGNPTIITTTTAHGYSNGFFTRVSGVTYTRLNGDGSQTPNVSIPQSTVTVVSPTQFSVPIDSTLGASKTSTATVGVYDFPSLTANITKADGSSTGDIAVPFHYWMSRWRWQSARRPVRTTYAALRDANLIPVFTTGNGLVYSSIATVSAYTPMAYSSIGPDQGSGGIGPLTGLITGWQMEYLMGRTSGLSDPEVYWRDYAEAAGTMQVCIRDTQTEAPLNLQTYPKIGINPGSQSGATSFWYRTQRNQPDGGHFPAAEYVPYLLTGDPYYLELLQFTANYQMAVSPGSAPPRTRYANIGRYYAWPLRSIGQAYTATPDVVPNWLLPKSYWKYLLDGGLAQGMANANNLADPFYSVFHTMQEAGQGNAPDLGKSGDHIWQHSYISVTACWLAALYPADWGPFATWIIQSEIDRTSATSGWRRDHVAPYQLRMQNASGLAVPMTLTDTSLVLQWRDTFAPGESVTIDSEVMTLGTTRTCSFTGSISGNTLTVSSVSSGSIAVGDYIKQGAATGATQVLSFGTGTGGIGTYTVSPVQSFTGDTSHPLTTATSSFVGSISGTTLTVTKMNSGAISVGQSINTPAAGTFVYPGMFVASFGTGSGGLGTYTVYVPQTVPSGPMTSWDGLTWTIASRPNPRTHTAPAGSFPTGVYGRKFTSWSEAVTSNQMVYGSGQPGTGKQSWIYPPVDGYSATDDLTYGMFTRAALAQALRAGLTNPGLLDSYNWQHGQMVTFFPTAPTNAAWDNWSIMPG